MDIKFIETIRKKRIEKEISIQEISNATRINVTFLEAIDRGDFDVLPKPYIRSFIRQYANYVGIDAESEIAKLENLRINKPTVEKKTINDDVPQDDYDVVLSSNSSVKKVFVSFAVAGAFALFIYILAHILGGGDEMAVERPFHEVVREVEEKTAQRPIEPLETQHMFQPDFRDSLEVSVSVLDTVWLTVTLDNLIQEEYIFYPGRRHRWKAANELLITVGNAGGISMTINGDSVGTLGGSGQVLRNLQITRDGIQR